MARRKFAERENQFAQRILASVAGEETFGIARHHDFAGNRTSDENRPGQPFKFGGMNSDFTIQGEVLILPDGKILAHNIAPEIAAILSELDPRNELMRQRAGETLNRTTTPQPLLQIKP